MSRTIGGPRIWRAALLLLIGAALGATLIAPVAGRTSAASAPAVTTYTRSASCAGLSFQPNDSDTGSASSGTLRHLSDAQGDGFFLCDPGLPNGAVVTKVQFTVLDDDGSGGADVRECALVRSGLTRATATSAQVLAGSLSSVEGAGAQRLTDASIDFGTINNAKYGYWLQCQIGFVSPGVGIYGANVIYTISAANG